MRPYLASTLAHILHSTTHDFSARTHLVAVNGQPVSTLYESVPRVDFYLYKEDLYRLLIPGAVIPPLRGYRLGPSHYPDLSAPHTLVPHKYVQRDADRMFRDISDRYYDRSSLVTKNLMPAHWSVNRKLRLDNLPHYRADAPSRGVLMPERFARAVSALPTGILHVAHVYGPESEPVVQWVLTVNRRSFLLPVSTLGHDGEHYPTITIPMRPIETPAGADTDTRWVVDIEVLASNPNVAPIKRIPTARTCHPIDLHRKLTNKYNPDQLVSSVLASDGSHFPFLSRTLQTLLTHAAEVIAPVQSTHLPAFAVYQRSVQIVERAKADIVRLVHGMPTATKAEVHLLAMQMLSDPTVAHYIADVLSTDKPTADAYARRPFVHRLIPAADESAALQWLASMRWDALRLMTMRWGNTSWPSQRVLCPSLHFLIQHRGDVGRRIVGRQTAARMHALGLEWGIDGT